MVLVTKAKITVANLAEAKLTAEMASRNQCGCMDTYCC